MSGAAAPVLSAPPVDAGGGERVIVGIGDLKVVQGHGQLVMTFALGSCLGLTLWDAEARVGALLHAMLPTARLGSDKMKNNPFMFVDTGVPEAFRRSYELGLDKSRVQCVVAGGACTYENPDKDVFQIGRKNLTILEKLLEKNGVALRARDVGGHHSRTLVLDVATGKVTVQSGREVKQL